MHFFKIERNGEEPTNWPKNLLIQSRNSGANDHVYSWTKTLYVWVDSNSCIFSRGHATLHLAVSVGRLVRPSVRPSVTFLNSERFLHYCSCPTVRDWIAVYPALFIFPWLPSYGSFDKGHVFSFFNLSFSMQIKFSVGSYLVIKENCLQKMYDFFVVW